MTLHLPNKKENELKAGQVQNSGKITIPSIFFRFPMPTEIVKMLKLKTKSENVHRLVKPTRAHRFPICQGIEFHQYSRNHNRHAALYSVQYVIRAGKTIN